MEKDLENKIIGSYSPATYQFFIITSEFLKSLMFFFQISKGRIPLIQSVFFAYKSF